MVASDQNKVFDTGDPGPRASGPAPGPLGNNGAAQVPQHGPAGPGVLGLVVAVPASLPVQPIGADLIKMQDLLLSQKREELFGKKKKNKNKPNKNLVKTTATITSQEVVVVDRNTYNISNNISDESTFRCSDGSTHRRADRCTNNTSRSPDVFGGLLGCVKPSSFSSGNPMRGALPTYCWEMG